MNTAVHVGWCLPRTSNPVGLPFADRSVRLRLTSANLRRPVTRRRSARVSDRRAQSAGCQRAGRGSRKRQGGRTSEQHGPEMRLRMVNSPSLLQFRIGC